jgi:hypothetical protein
MTKACYGLVITHNRHDILAATVQQLRRQVSHVVVMDNASNPPVDDNMSDGVHVIHDALQPPNIAYLWNVGLSYLAQLATDEGHDEWYVALICDDISLPDDWVPRVVDTMMRVHATAGSTHHNEGVLQNPLVKTSPDHDLYNRMQGAAFVLAGHKGISADETMHWWWCDTDMDFQSRITGGMVLVPGPIAVNTRPNDYTAAKPELMEQAGKDGERFTQKWGFRPW